MYRSKRLNNVRVHAFHFVVFFLCTDEGRFARRRKKTTWKKCRYTALINLDFIHVLQLSSFKNSESCTRFIPQIIYHVQFTHTHTHTRDHIMFETPLNHKRLTPPEASAISSIRNVLLIIYFLCIGSDVYRRELEIQIVYRHNCIQ